MSTNCERPGCGHGVDSHNGSRCCIESAEILTDGGTWVRCDCKGYRTAEQQEAWERVPLVLGSWGDPESKDYDVACQMEKLLVRLLAVNP